MAANPLMSVTEWIRKGYPQGVPPKDFPPLLALLLRSLSPQEVDRVVAQVIAENPDGEIRLESVAGTIAQVKAAPPTPDDVNDVASRLAAVGWPLSVPESTLQDILGSDPEDGGGGRRPVLERVQGWLKAGYPQGVPAADFVPLLALLHRRLTDAEVKAVAKSLIAEHQENGDEAIAESSVSERIAAVTQMPPTEADLDRVRGRLARKGWPLQSETDSA